MNQLFTFRTLPLALTVFLGACALTQPPAPVVSGNGAGYGNNHGGYTTAADNNPYGAQPKPLIPPPTPRRLLRPRPIPRPQPVPLLPAAAATLRLTLRWT